MSPNNLRQSEEFIAVNGHALSLTTACVEPAFFGFDASAPHPSWADATLQSLKGLFNLPVVARPTPFSQIDNTNTAVNLVDSDTESTIQRRTKSPKRMNQQKPFAYFKRNGVAGFFSEMLWHLLS